MPKVTVVIPAYNAMKFLPETVENLLEQNFEDFEAIIVDDGSTDDIQQWVEQVNDPRVQMISQANQGLSGARNTGILHALGEYIAFLDADDKWHPSKLTKQVALLDQNPEVGLVYTGVAMIDEHSIPTGRVVVHQSAGDVWGLLVAHNLVECGSVALVRRQCFEQVGMFDREFVSFIEDLDMWIRIASHYAFAVVPEPLVYYRQHSGGASKNWRQMERAYHRLYEKAFAAAPTRFSPTQLKQLQRQYYGQAYCNLAWKPLQAREQDCQVSLEYQKRALQAYPELRFSKENLRLTLALVLARSLGFRNYKQILAVFYAIRRQLAAGLRGHSA